MDEQNLSETKRTYTAEEIARLEAEAVAALQRGESAPKVELKKAPTDGDEKADANAAPEFVPYVDDVPDSEPTPNAAADDEADDEDDGEYIPSEMEKRIEAMTPEQWKRWQIIGGAAVGLASVACLFVFGEELATYGLIVAVLLAVLLPRYLERAWRRKLTVARYAMIAAMVVGLVVMGIIIISKAKT